MELNEELLLHAKKEDLIDYIINVFHPQSIMTCIKRHTEYTGSQGVEEEKGQMDDDDGGHNFSPITSPPRILKSSSSKKKSLSMKNLQHIAPYTAVKLYKLNKSDLAIVYEFPSNSVVLYDPRIHHCPEEKSPDVVRLYTFIHMISKKQLVANFTTIREQLRVFNLKKNQHFVRFTRKNIFPEWVEEVKKEILD
jgi:hypothetical protein